MIVRPSSSGLGLTITMLGFDYGSAGSKITPRMEPALPWPRAGHLDGCRSAGAPGSAPSPARPAHLGVYQTHSGERSLRVPRRAPAGRVLERGAEPRGGWMRARSLELGACHPEGSEGVKDLRMTGL